jgi:hypothetical protein
MRCNPHCCCGYEDNVPVAATPSWDLVEQAMRHGCDCVTPQGRLFSALLQQKKKIRCALAKYTRVTS